MRIGWNMHHVCTTIYKAYYTYYNIPLIQKKWMQTDFVGKNELPYKIFNWLLSRK